MTFTITLIDCAPIVLPEALIEVADQITRLHDTCLRLGGEPGEVSAIGRLADGGRYEVSTTG